MHPVFLLVLYLLLLCILRTIRRLLLSILSFFHFLSFIFKPSSLPFVFLAVIFPLRHGLYGRLKSWFVIFILLDGGGAKLKQNEVFLADGFS